MTFEFLPVVGALPLSSKLTIFTCSLKMSLCWAVLCGGRVEGVESEGPRLPQSHFTRRPISFITAAHNPGVEHEPE